MYSVPLVSSSRPKDECGVFGIYLPHHQVWREIYFGLFSLQHRGQESAGIAVTDGVGMSAGKGRGLVSQAFNKEQKEIDSLLRGSMGIGHVRYSTTGSTNERNAQPLLSIASDLPASPGQTRLDFQGESSFGYSFLKDAEIAIAHNGNIVNAPELRRRLELLGYRFRSTTDSEVIVYLIHERLKGTLPSQANANQMLMAVKHALDNVQGGYALLIMTPNALIATRDPHGIRPLVMGSVDERGDVGHIFASETCALDIVGGRFIREIHPSECVLLDRKAKTPTPMEIISSTDNNGLKKKPAFCVFENIYFARPDSEFYGILVEDTRERMGKILAREHPVNADFVVGIPDSGIPAAVGYAEEQGIKNVTGLIKNRYVLRTFIQPNQHLRDLGIKLKLNPLRKKIKGQKIVLIDDSIVRGTTTRKVVSLLRDAGAVEVHMRVSCPPIKYPCFYGIDTSCRKDLIAASRNVAQIREYIGADSLEFLSVEGLLEAVYADEHNGYCDACLTNNYPTPVPKEYDKFALES